jgi:hypothetical protein
MVGRADREQVEARRAQWFRPLPIHLNAEAIFIFGQLAKFR